MTLIKSISGIRGTIGGEVGSNLTPVDTVKFAAAFGSWLIERNTTSKVILGRDARASGEMVSQLIAYTLCGMGIKVIDVGLSTTPSVELAVISHKAGGGIIITASHNPVQWNALKLLNENGEFLSAVEGSKILEKAESDNYKFAEVYKLGSVTVVSSSIDDHINAVLAYPLVDVDAISRSGLRIVVDGVNSTGGIAVPALLRRLGILEIEELNCSPTGKFAHNPEPIPEHLGQISAVLQNGNFDLGLVVDPDVDRLAILCEDGSMFGEEYSLVAIADYILSKRPGPTVSNLSSTRALRDLSEKWGQSYFASAVGEVNVVEKMKEVQAVIGGEGNGGIIVPDFHYGRDALIGIALFLTHLVQSKKSCSVLRATYPNYHISKNKIELTPKIDVDEVLEGIATQYARFSVNKIDGVKIDFEEEWVHLRKSNTEPIIRVYAESKSETTADTLAKKIMNDIRELITEKEES